MGQPKSDQSGRELHSVEALRFKSRSCLALTVAGVAFAKSIVADSDAPTSKTRDILPHWNSEDRQLYVGENVIRDSHARACSQECILIAFENQGWPPRIDDPLPQRVGADGKLRLNKTIYRLNRSLTSPHIRFTCDGTGTGVCWEFNGA